LDDGVSDRDEGSPTFWTGDRIRLRGPEPGDWTFFRDLDRHSAGARSVDRLYPPRSAEAYREWAATTARATPDGDELFLVIEALGTGPVGSINTTGTDRRAGRYQHGVAVHPDHRRRGYAAEAITLVQRYMFGELRYHKCEADVYGYNTASLALHERLGFCREGVLRDHEFFAGRHVDVVRFGMTAAEFAGRHSFPEL
jgi:RimJ/RimL family protein N-acetyltransferase